MPTVESIAITKLSACTLDSSSLEIVIFNLFILLQILLQSGTDDNVFKHILVLHLQFVYMVNESILSYNQVTW
jgi:hypothetical protein